MMTPEQIRDLRASATWQCHGCGNSKSQQATKRTLEDHTGNGTTIYNICWDCWIKAFPNER